jgi:hypothetical protein
MPRNTGLVEGRVITFSNTLKDGDELLVVLSVDLGQVNALEVAFLVLSRCLQVIEVLIGSLPAMLCCETPTCRCLARHHTDNDHFHIDAASPCL